MKFPDIFIFLLTSVFARRYKIAVFENVFITFLSK
ncbi:hypothetical protein HCH_06911 [Hahella chejuensis KCTC 2396]|uniref:Uncharacterized protein n=1 Tax=Hahella chejuensis (strain KCTC 2396) TaxID=349521 RepID=Q2S745_HAHCH|nr:hypothetical protein HCH_06911 [Hahella chejuensis KCTC 2396]